MARYILWDRTSGVIPPSGEVFTAEQWTARYPASAVIDYVMSGEEVAQGYVSGALMQSYASMKSMYAAMGCDFTGIQDGQPVLDAIEAFEDEKAAEEEAERAAREAEAEAAAEAAAELAQREVEALEDLVVLNMPDIPEEV